ncbi:MAG: molecular chaperone DnaK [Planctomycetes bacterium RBG_16_64_10]|nr:MAG: molecular chaperone DnaK [Planctomycetes bacterium RBG_16_64_10]
MAAQYVLGIDLGTTNSVLAYASLDQDAATIEPLAIPQLVAAGTVESRPALPSFLYLPLEEECRGGAYDLPWRGGLDLAVGELARRQAAEVPHRTVGAAKSWLCHRRVDRHQAILPWNAPDTVPKLSPVTASQRYLEHLVAAWEDAFPQAPVQDQHVVLTVPASFDASARELTREAALAAGLPPDLVLVEEPQAAVYAWLSDVGDRWRQTLQVGDTLLVCDIGGGTTDLSLVRAAEAEGELVLERVAVGSHLLVGGDNMDLTLAHHVAGRFAAQGVQLDPWQSVALWHSCRDAKEILLSPAGPPTHSIAVLGRGSRLIGKTVSVDVERPQVRTLLLDGFFPRCAVTDRPARHKASGFLEMGLPFESDTAVTRHLAAFLQAHSKDPDGPIRPKYVLFNGGVFNSEPLRARLLEVMGDWFGKDRAPRILPATADLQHAVARGAACYGWAKQRGGVRIRGGTARAYYVGVETSGPAVPGAPRPLRALCVVPAGMEEGTALDVPTDGVGLVVGERAHFRFFGSSVRKQDRPGDVITSWAEGELIETDGLETMLAADDRIDEPFVPVRFHARITELGVLELWCVSTTTDNRWRLEFSVRDQTEA